MKKGIRLLVSCIICASLLVGCSTGTVNKKEFSSVLVTQEGGITDRSFNQSAWEGLKRAEKDLGVKVSYIESTKEADFAINLENATDRKPNLVWGIGFKLAPAVETVAKANPDQYYGLVDSTFDDGIPKNLVCVTFQEHECAFLAGNLAAMHSQTGTIGFIGAMENPIIERFCVGFKAGVLSASKEMNKKMDVKVQYTNSFTDSAKGKDVAVSMYSGGCDVIFHCAGFSGVGAIEAAKDSGKAIIGVDMDQSNLAPENVIASAVKCVDNAIFDLTKKLKASETSFIGQNVVMGLKEGGVDLVGISNPDEQKKIDSIKKEIIDGKILIPRTTEEYEKFVLSLEIAEQK